MEAPQDEHHGHGDHLGSSELQERVRVLLNGLVGVTQIKDDVVICSQGPACGWHMRTQTVTMTSSWAPPSRPTQEEEEPAQEKQGPEQGAEVAEKSGDSEEQATEAGPRKSRRRRRAPDRYLAAQPAEERQEGPSQLSPRDRKRIKSLAARKVPREKWMIRQEGAWRKLGNPLNRSRRG